jgi:iron complex outermembrane receptor protein
MLHTEIDDKNVYAQVGLAVINGVPTLSETVLNPLKQVGTNFFAQINGNPLPSTPDYNLNVDARYDVPIGGDMRIFVSTDFNMQGKTNYVLYRTVEYTSDGNYELGAKVGFDFGRYEIAAFARNLTNTKRTWST